MEKKIMKYTITIEDSNGNKAIYRDIEARDFHLKLENDLRPAPNFIGNWLTPAPYSRGMRLNLSAYIPNKDETKDINEAVVASYKNYNQISQITETSNNQQIGSFFGLEIIPLNCMPDGEALFFQDKKMAYEFVSIANNYGYENAKKYSNILIKIQNLKINDSKN